MQLSFAKYQGTGNDFIMIDCRENPNFQLEKDQITRLCDRRFGIGADGLILIFTHPKLNFEMRYFNSDGTRSFCGNGARCAVQFAHTLGLFQTAGFFGAIDGVHEATLENGSVALNMNPVSTLKKDNDAFIIHTGSPHYIKFVDQLEKYDITQFGRKIRYSDFYKKEGINVNIVEKLSTPYHLKMQTYERGVEAETFSCGTGATAVALAAALQQDEQKFSYTIEVKGGTLSVKGQKNEEGFINIQLIGPAQHVFTGTIEL